MFDLAAIDIGNTNITIAYFRNGEIKRKENRKTKNISSTFKLLLSDKILIASVVPKATEKILKRYPLAEVLSLDNVPEVGFPNNIGIDRAINCITAMKLYKTMNVLVVDIGTAMTFTYCSKGQFNGGLIMPGYGLSKKMLTSNAELLPDVPEVAEESIICQETHKAMAAGVLNLYKRAIASLIEDYRGKKKKVIVVITGGDSLFFSKYLNNYDIVNPTLLLEGIYLLSKD